VPGGLAVLLTSQDLLPAVLSRTRSVQGPFIKHSSTDCKDNHLLNVVQADSNTITSSESYACSMENETCDVERNKVCSMTESNAHGNMLSKTQCHVHEKEDSQGVSLQQCHSTESERCEKTVPFKISSGNGQMLVETERFHLLSHHYVKLGETHAYIVVLRKPS
jgi:hypothetical protein